MYVSECCLELTPFMNLRMILVPLQARLEMMSGKQSFFAFGKEAILLTVLSWS